MFRELRRLDKRLPIHEGEKILELGVFGVLSSVGEDGYPYGVPVNYVFADRAIYFHCALSGHKLDNLSSCEKVSFCVVTNVKVIPEAFSTTYTSVVAFGTASLIQDRKEKIFALEELVRKYSLEHFETGKYDSEKLVDTTGIVRVTIEHLSVKGSFPVTQ